MVMFIRFLMTDFICYSSLLCAVLEKVALTYCFFCKNVDHVCILVRHEEISTKK